MKEGIPNGYEYFLYENLF